MGDLKGSGRVGLDKYEDPFWDPPEQVFFGKGFI